MVKLVEIRIRRFEGTHGLFLLLFRFRQWKFCSLFELQFCCSVILANPTSPNKYWETNQANMLYFDSKSLLCIKFLWYLFSKFSYNFVLLYWRWECDLMCDCAEDINGFNDFVFTNAVSDIVFEDNDWIIELVYRVSGFWGCDW